MKEEAIKEIQTRIGATPDGHWGPKSIAAAKVWLKRLNAYNRQWPLAFIVYTFSTKPAATL